MKKIICWTFGHSWYESITIGTTITSKEVKIKKPVTGVYCKNCGIKKANEKDYIG